MSGLIKTINKYFPSDEWEVININIMNKSKIKHVTGNGHFEGKYGKMYKYEYTFEDGTVMEANHKTEECPFKIGDELEYEITRTHDTYGNRGKVSKPQEEFKKDSFKSNMHQDAILYQVCLKEALNIISFDGWNGKEDVADKCQYITDLAYQIAVLSKKRINELKSK